MTDRRGARRSSQLPPDARSIRLDNLTSPDDPRGRTGCLPVRVRGQDVPSRQQASWKTNEEGMERLSAAQATCAPTATRFATSDTSTTFPCSRSTTSGTTRSRRASAIDKVYVVQTNTKVIERCILMTTDPGDLVLDPTCGSGTTAYVAEQWGRRWITIDTSPRRAGAGPHPADGRPLPLLPARRLARGPQEAGRADRHADRPRRARRRSATCTRGSCTAPCRTSPSRASPTTPTSRRA